MMATKTKDTDDAVAASLRDVLNLFRGLGTWARTVYPGALTEDLLGKLRAAVPGLVLRTTLITGFPGETEDEFAELLEFVKATRFERLNREFFTRIAAVPCARFVTVREDKSGAMVAFMLCFELAPKLINKFVGMDYRRPGEWQLHFRLWDAVVDYALSRGLTSIQSGQTGYAVKIETGHRLVPLTRLVEP